jgi:hypothetical protein
MSPLVKTPQTTNFSKQIDQEQTRKDFLTKRLRQQGKDIRNTSKPDN